MADYSPPAPKVQQQDLGGKVALVTGASKGIGRAIALDLATRGCSIIGTYTSPESAHHFDVLSTTISTLYTTSNLPRPTLTGIVADITTLASIRPILAALPPKLDILVLSAAFNTRPRLGQASEADIEHSLMGNLHWPIVLVENLVRQKLLNVNARVVALSSDRVRDPNAGSALFNATKAGLEALVRGWAVELPLTFPGTTVNAVSVGLTDTPGLRQFPREAVQALKEQRVPKVKVVEGGRMGFAEDVADVVGFLVSEKARWVTGSVVAANGGAEWIGGMR
ncbi:hypothetical protein JI435_086590 [Parastagonospora nodorum SN15]|uniref:Rhodanese domain-containing protein n=1 Tax=Phaeosphaeria nodorum (strain SN15 / ATCC MYA-4574 / FGSC 10173) TaxID=321614 RepID=A0A7U2F2P8_PHANO|nr:hypothetical protein JI435_086590 [Parastagonospora nodorum SN15]